MGWCLLPFETNETEPCESVGGNKRRRGSTGRSTARVQQKHPASVKSNRHHTNPAGKPDAGGLRRGRNSPLRNAGEQDRAAARFLIHGPDGGATEPMLHPDKKVKPKDEMDDPPNDVTDVLDVVEPWVLATLEQLRRQAEDLATSFAARSVQERAQRPRSQRGELGVRVRFQPSARSGEGSFTCEWYLVRGRRRTRYLSKGRGDRYPRSAFRSAQPWERDLAAEYEPQLARIRTLARSAGEIRRQAKRHVVLQRKLDEDGCGTASIDGDTLS